MKKQQGGMGGMAPPPGPAPKKGRKKYVLGQKNSSLAGTSTKGKEELVAANKTPEKKGVQLESTESPPEKAFENLTQAQLAFGKVGVEEAKKVRPDLLLPTPLKNTSKGPTLRQSAEKKSKQ